MDEPGGVGVVGGGEILAKDAGGIFRGNGRSGQSGIWQIDCNQHFGTTPKVFDKLIIDPLLYHLINLMYDYNETGMVSIH